MVQREKGGKEKGGSVEKRGDVFIFTFSTTGLAAIYIKKKIPLSSQSGSLEPHRKMTAVVKERGWEYARTETVWVVRRI